MSINKEFAVKNDTELKKLWNELSILRGEIKSIQRSIATGYNYNPSFDASRLENQLRQLREQYDEANNKALELEKNWADNGFWSRAFIVINHNGHIHKSMKCSTCFITTKFDFLPNYSGSDEMDIIKAAGEMACTVCYPHAPAWILNQPCTIVSEHRLYDERKEKEMAEKKAEKINKNILKNSTVDGSPLEIDDHTIVAEKTAISEWVQCRVENYVPSGVRVSPEEFRHIICQSLADKHQRTFAEQEQILEEAAKKKIAKNIADYKRKYSKKNTQNCPHHIGRNVAILQHAIYEIESKSPSFNKQDSMVASILSIENMLNTLYSDLLESKKEYTDKLKNMSPDIFEGNLLESIGKLQIQIDFLALHLSDSIKEAKAMFIEFIYNGAPDMNPAEKRNFDRWIANGKKLNFGQCIVGIFDQHWLYDFNFQG